MELENNIAVLGHDEEKALELVLSPSEWGRLAVINGGVYATRLAATLEKHFPDIDFAEEPMRTMRQQLADAQH